LVSKEQTFFYSIYSDRLYTGRDANIALMPFWSYGMKDKESRLSNFIYCINISIPPYDYTYSFDNYLKFVSVARKILGDLLYLEVPANIGNHIALAAKHDIDIPSIAEYLDQEFDECY